MMSNVYLNLKHKRLLMASAALAALAAAVVFIAGLSGQYLCLINEDSGQTLLLTPAEDGSEFAVSFTHSVNKSPVIEYYRVENGQIYLDSLRYQAFGAGMPTELDPGQTISYENSTMLIEGFNRPIYRLVYSIGRVANHNLHWQEQDIPLNTLDAPGQPVLFTIIVYSRLKAALHIYP